MIRDPKRDLKLKKRKGNVGWDDIKPPEGDPMTPSEDLEDPTVDKRKFRRKKTDII
ncbi:MAG: hypothetical protein ACFFCS_15955 [Candidatus Hodarchaeota archaeon]